MFVAAVLIGCLVLIVCLLPRVTRESSPDRGDQPSFFEPPRKTAAVPQLPAAKAFPKTIAFLDVETTGLSTRDRIVTLGVVLINTDELQAAEANCKCLHRIYDPGIKCHPEAKGIHGHNDWTLRHQPFFAEEAEEVREFLERAGLICCHHAEFDLGFVNRELLQAGLKPLSKPAFCTMRAYKRHNSGSASLDHIAARLGLHRTTKWHGALEDAFLTANVFLALNQFSGRIPVPDRLAHSFGFQNFRVVPPLPEGPLPLRKRRPRASIQTRVETGV
jgi:DNA polymerase-3 subunit epsilon